MGDVPPNAKELIPFTSKLNVTGLFEEFTEFKFNVLGIILLA